MKLMRRVSLVALALLLSCAQKQDFTNDNPFDTKGDTFHPPLVTVIDSAMAVSVYDTVRIPLAGTDEGADDSIVSFMFWIDGDSSVMRSAPATRDAAAATKYNGTLVLPSGFAKADTGIHRIYTRAYARNGVPSNNVDSIDVTVSLNAPLLTLPLDTLADLAVGEMFNVWAGGSDENGSVASYRWTVPLRGGFDTVTTADSISLTVTDTGWFPLIVRAVDDDTASSIAGTVFLHISAYPPSVAVEDTIDAYSSYNSTIAASFVASRAPARNFVWNIPGLGIVDSSTTGNLLPVRFLEAGNFNGSVYAFDTRGVRSNVESFLVQVVAGVPHMTGLTPDTVVGAADTLCTITASAKAVDDAAVTRYFWEFDALHDGWDDTTTNGLLQLRRQGSGGPVSVGVCAEDAQGLRIRDSMQVWFNRAPAVSVVSAPADADTAVWEAYVSATARGSVRFMFHAADADSLVDSVRYNVFCGPAAGELALAWAGKDSFCLVDNLNANENRQWRVVAIDGHGDTSVATGSFTTLPALADKVIGVGGRGLSTTSIRVTWQRSSRAKSYTVLRGSSASGPWSTVESDIADSLVSDIGLDAGTAYWYRLIAVNRTGASDSSIAVSIVTLPSAPAGGAASALSPKSLRVRWNKTTGAASYVVYRSGTLGGAYDSLASVFDTTFDDTGLVAQTSYFYRVSAVNASGYSAQSAAIQGNTPASNADGMVATTASATSLRLTWKSVAGAEQYLLYRAGVREGNFVSVLATITVPETTYVDAGLVPGATYYYTSRVQHTGGVNSPFGDTIAGTVPPAMPAAPAVSALSPTSAHVAWNKMSGATAYVVYRASAVGGPYDSVTVVGDSTYDDLGLTPGDTLWYAVEARNLGGGIGRGSSAELQLPAGKPDSIWAVLADREFVRVNWTKVAGAVRYGVYRKEKGSDKAVDSIGVAFDTVFTDTSIVDGTEYQYQVRMFYSNGFGAFTDFVSLWTMPATPDWADTISEQSWDLDLAWHKIKGPATYQIYRSLDMFSGFAKIAEITDTLYTDVDCPDSVECYYKIVAVNSAGSSLESIISAGKTNTPVVTLTTEFVAPNTVNLIFNTVPESETYRIYRADEAGSNWGLIDSVSAAGYSQSDLRGAYQYRVEAKSMNERKSSFSEDVPALYIPSVPTLNWKRKTKSITITGGGSTTRYDTLSWSQVPNCDSYRITYFVNYQNVSKTDIEVSAVFVNTSTALFVNSSNSGQTGSTYSNYQIEAINVQGGSGRSGIPAIINVP